MTCPPSLTNRRFQPLLTHSTSGCHPYTAYSNSRQVGCDTPPPCQARHTATAVFNSALYNCSCTLISLEGVHARSHIHQHVHTACWEGDSYSRWWSVPPGQCLRSSEPHPSTITRQLIKVELAKCAVRLEKM